MTAGLSFSKSERDSNRDAFPETWRHLVLRIGGECCLSVQKRNREAEQG